MQGQQSNRFGAAFFAVEVSLRQIEQSPYAVEFTAVERPDEWRNRLQDESLTDTQETQLQFCEGFVNHADEQGLSEYTGTTPSHGSAYDIYIGLSPYIRPTANFQSDELAVMVRFRDETTTFAELQRDEFETALEEAIEEIDPTHFDQEITDDIVWDQAEPSDKYDHIRLRRRDVDFENQDLWPEYHEWLLEAPRLFNSALARTVEWFVLRLSQLGRTLPAVPISIRSCSIL